MRGIGKLGGFNLALKYLKKGPVAGVLYMVVSYQNNVFWCKYKYHQSDSRQCIITIQTIKLSPVDASLTI